MSLFDRRQRQPSLTEAGQALLAQAQQVLAANDRLNRCASQLSEGQEPRLTVVLSDTFQSETFAAMLRQIDLRYPTLRFECLIAEYEDVVALVQQGRAHLGLMAAQDSYPPDVGYSALKEKSELVLCVGRGHPLAALPHVTSEQLRAERELRLSTYELDNKDDCPAQSTWSAPGYLMLSEMASQGMAGPSCRAGWCSATAPISWWNCPCRAGLGTPGGRRLVHAARAGFRRRLAVAEPDRGVTRGISAGQRPGARCARRWCAAIRPSSGRPALRTPRGAGATWRNRRCCPWRGGTSAGRRRRH